MSEAGRRTDGEVSLWTSAALWVAISVLVVSMVVGTAVGVGLADAPEHDRWLVGSAIAAFGASAAATVLFVGALEMQRQERDAQRAELRQTRRVHEEQRETLERQVEQFARSEAHRRQQDARVLAIDLIASLAEVSAEVRYANAGSPRHSALSARRDLLHELVRLNVEAAQTVLPEEEHAALHHAYHKLI